MPQSVFPNVFYVMFNPLKGNSILDFSVLCLLDAGSHLLCSLEHVPHCLEDPDFVAILKEVRNEPTLDSDAAASDIKAFSFQSDKEDVAKKRLADFAKTNAPSNVGIQTKLHFSMPVRTPTSSPKSSHTFCSPDSHKEKDGRDEDFSEDSQAKDRRELETKDEKQPRTWVLNPSMMIAKRRINRNSRRKMKSNQRTWVLNPSRRIAKRRINRNSRRKMKRIQSARILSRQGG